MIVGLCWILGIYALGILLVHALQSRLWPAENKASIQVALLTHNNQLQIEWYLRYLIFVSWWRGRPVHVTLVDSGSTDDTLAIARRMSNEIAMKFTHTDPTEEWVPHEDGTFIVIRLRDRSDLVQVPLIP